MVKVGDEVEIIGLKEKAEKTTVTGVEMFKKMLDSGQAGDNVGCLLRGVARDGIERGQVLAKPGSIKPHKKFECEVYVLSKEEGGRHTPFFAGYRPQFYFRTTDVTGSTKLLGGVEMVLAGRQRQDGGRADGADRHGRRRPVRHSRRRQDGRLGRGHQDPRVMTKSGGRPPERLRGRHDRPRQA